MRGSNLRIQNLTVKSGGRTAVIDVSLTIEPGQVACVLGPNGAGKSELVLAVAGRLPRTGLITLGETDLSSADAGFIRTCGVAAVPEGHHVLTRLSVDDNLRAAGAMHDAAALQDARDHAYTVFPELQPLRAQRAGTLSGGQQQMVALAQALVCRPKFLLIDEMSLGLAPIVIDRLMNVVMGLKSDGIGILLIEQFTHLALDAADHAYVMNQGRMRFSGPPEELKDNPEILQRLYLAA